MNDYIKGIGVQGRPIRVESYGVITVGLAPVETAVRAATYPEVDVIAHGICRQAIYRASMKPVRRPAWLIPCFAIIGASIKTNKILIITIDVSREA
jgi:hypothetical protein